VIKDYSCENTDISDVLGIYRKDKDSKQLLVIDTLVKIGFITETDTY
jgi:hypothetical protein